MDRTNLARLLDPASVAVVGASEKLAMSNNAVLPMLEAGREVHLVNPNRDSVYGRPTVPSLADLAAPVDAVLSLVSADRSVGVVAEAARLGCGGVAVAAGGFAELGGDGAALQRALVEAAGPALAVVGPNCSGFMNVVTGANLFTGGRISLRPGPVAVVSQSGFLLRSCLAAGQQRQLGFSVAVSSGNEAVCDLADYLDHFADDPATRVICLVIEKVRDAASFLGAVARARAAGKGVVALKLGRTARSRDIMRSHTGAIADESWVYDLVLRQAGVVTSVDVDDLLDRAQLLAQLPPERWRPVRGIAVMASSGWVAGVAADLSSEEGVELADLSPLEPWVRDRVPGTDASVNPLDLTGFVMRDPDLLREIFTGYATAPGLDALVLCWWAGEGDEGWARTLLDPFADVAAASPVPLVVSPVEATAVGSWTAAYGERGLSFCRGLRSTYRALQALGAAAAADSPAGGVAAPAAGVAAPAAGVATPAAGVAAPAAAARPSAAPARQGKPAGTARSAVPTLVPGQGVATFAEAMALLDEVGIPIAPFVLLGEDADDDPAISSLGDRLVVKLADVPHRTEHGAVRVDVAPTDLVRTVRELRELAAAHGLPTTVVVQPMLVGLGEAFVGVQGRTDLGPLVLLGAGGVLVELARNVGGRLLPLGAGAAASLADEVAGRVGTIRGQQPWPRGALSATVEAAGRLWERTSSWLDSLDVNPLVVMADRVVAVDALVLARDGAARSVAEQLA